MDREIYQKQYDFELDQRNSIASAINIPMMAITILGGALSATILGFSYSANLTTYAFCFLVGISLISMSYSLLCVFKSFLGYSYQKLPQSSLIAKHYKTLIDWHRNEGKSQNEAEVEAKKDFHDYINLRLSEAAEHNGNNNITRGNYLHKSTMWVAVSVFFIFLTSLVFVHNKLENKNKTYDVKIVNEIKLDKGAPQMADETNNNTGSGTQEASPAQTPTAAPIATTPKPTGPPNIVFRGNSESPKIETRTNNTKKE
jgi:hypothetical protein